MIFILSSPCVMINVYQSTNYDNTDLRILFTFGITSLDAFRYLLFTPSGFYKCFISVLTENLSVKVFSAKL
jgi:hypothetical protein